MKKRPLTHWILLLNVFSASLLTASQIREKEISTANYKKVLKQITPMTGTTPTQWRVTWTGDTSTEATISWSTAEAGTKHTVHIGTKGFGNDVTKYEQHIDCQKNSVYSLDAKQDKDTAPAFYHHCRLKDLKPNTNYYFTLESDGKFSRQLYFKTSPKSGDFKLIIGGDSRSGLADRCRMNLRIANIFAEQKDILAFVHGGDFVQNGISWRQWRLWLSHNELTTLADGRVLPIIPTKGNHDGGPLFFEVFNLTTMIPKKRCYWHTAQVTEAVNIVTLDTNYTVKGPQEKWLKQQLQELRPKSKYLLTNYHRPLFPAVKTPAQAAGAFIPLFEKFNVDLALESDGHCIKRTVPIRNGKADPTGVVYVGEGGLGVDQRQPKHDLWYLKDGYVGRGHHVMLLDFSEKALTVEVIQLDGSIPDKTTIKPRK